MAKPFLVFQTGLEKGFATQTLSLSPKAKALLSKAFAFGLLKFASLIRTDMIPIPKSVATLLGIENQTQQGF